MKTILAATLLAGSLLVGCAANPAANQPSATVNSPASSPTAVASDPKAPHRDLVINESNSKVEFVGSKVTGSHNCSFKKFHGTVHLVEEEPTKSSVSVTIDMNSVVTDDADLTDHLKSPDFFDTAKYPESTFKSTLIAKTDKGYNMTGDFTLHGVTNSITFPASIAVTPEGFSARADFSIKRFDWKIMYPGKADNLIRDEVLIKLDLKGTPDTATHDPADASPASGDAAPTTSSPVDGDAAAASPSPADGTASPGDEADQAAPPQ